VEQQQGQKTIQGELAEEVGCQTIRPRKKVKLKTPSGVKPKGVQRPGIPKGWGKNELRHRRVIDGQRLLGEKRDRRPTRKKKPAAQVGRAASKIQLKHNPLHKKTKTEW